MVQKTPLFSTSIALVFAAHFAAAHEVSEEARACHMRTAQAGPEVPYDDYNLEMFSIHIGCLLEKRDQETISFEDLRVAVREAQGYIAREAPLPLTLRDNYQDPDGIIGPNFAFDYSQVAYIEAFAAPYFVLDGTVYGEGSTIERNLERFAEELVIVNAPIYNETRRSLDF